MIDLSLPWTELPLSIVDFETTGVDPNQCKPVQIGVVRMEKRQVVGSCSTLLNPGCPIPEEAAAIHGKTDEMCASAPLAEALQDVLASSDFRHLHQDALPCAYNEPYDRTILRRFVNMQEWEVCRLTQWVDPLVIIRRVDRFVRGSGRHKLTTTCERHGVRLDNAHDALGDCMSTGALLYKLLEAGHVKPVSAHVLLKHTAQMRAQQDADFQRYLARMEARASNG